MTNVNKWACCLILLFACVLSGATIKTSAATARVTALFCEHMTDPVAVDTKTPQLSWLLDSNVRGARQTAYRILVARDADALAAGRGDLWDSGKIKSEVNTGVRYAGMPLRSGQECCWQVQVWDEKDRASAWSAPGKWEIGLLDSTDWSAIWIGRAPGDDIPAPLFRKEFTIKGAVKKARLHIYGLGWYEAYLNGHKVGDHVLAPANSHYDRVNLYDTYDVTSQLLTGGNAVGVMLAGGYDSTYSKWGWKWEKTKRFLLQLRVELSDGSVQTIVSDGSWSTSSGPITACTMYHGELYDARLEKSGWSRFGFAAAGWLPVAVTESPGGRLLPNTMPPLRVIETITPVAIKEPLPGVYVVDMGQNFAGWARIRVNGTAGDSIKLHYSELVDSQGMIDPWTNRRAKATDIYVCRGDGEESYEPRFTYHGFRYVQVRGLRTPLTNAMIRGRVVHADLATAGLFSCSDSLLNRIKENFRWSMKSNFMSIPTDCAMRDERTPCSMDSRVYEEGAMYQFQVYRYYAKWLRDTSGGSGNPDWDGDPVLLAWRLYEWYGDASILAEHYDAMKRYVDIVRARTPNLIYKDGYGDWCAPNQGTWESYFSHVAVVNTALFQQCAWAVAQAARVMNHTSDVVRYGALADSIIKVFNETWLHEDEFYYGTGSQIEDILPLAFGYLEKGLNAKVAQHLVHTIMVDKDGHLDTGITGTRYIGDVLCDQGNPELCVDVFRQKTYPGFGHQIEQGATTTWEQWYAKGGMNSHNHAMFSGAMATLFSRLGGIQLSEPGFRKITIKPAFPKPLNWVRTELESARGRIESYWERGEGSLSLHVRVPVGAEAKVYIPAAAKELVHEGEKPAHNSPGVRYGGRVGAAEVFVVGSGVYEFKVMNQEGAK